MSKPEVLEIFARAIILLRRIVCGRDYKPRPDRRAAYSYLLRLKRQGLLETGPNVRRGNLAYRLTQRGHARLKYFRSQSI